MLLPDLITLWTELKAREVEAQKERRAVEDDIAKLIGIRDDVEGTTTVDGLKVTTRIDRKVDADKLVELARDAGLSDHLSALFRWKPEINRKVWDAADESITRPLADAITTKPARPSFSKGKDNGET